MPIPHATADIRKHTAGARNLRIEPIFLQYLVLSLNIFKGFVNWDFETCFETIDEACYAFIPVFPFLVAEEVKTQAQRTRIKNQTTHDQGQRTEEK